MQIGGIAAFNGFYIANPESKLLVVKNLGLNRGVKRVNTFYLQKYQS